MHNIRLMHRATAAYYLAYKLYNKAAFIMYSRAGAGEIIFYQKNVSPPPSTVGKLAIPQAKI